jgi:hypothetical protein
MTMPISNDLDLAYLAIRHMITLHRPENALLEKLIVALGVAWQLEPRLSDIKRLACARVLVGFVVCFRSTSRAC